MPRFSSRGTTRSYRARRTRSTRAQGQSYTRLERLAYNLGRINRGIKNPNSRVHESYQNGCVGKTTKNLKPLI